MDKMSDEPSSPVKRSDVGYKRPPREHQFKKGEKPPPRKKIELRAVPMSETARKVLEEERRIEIGNKVRWVTKAELVIMRALQEAEKGSATMRRLMLRLALSGETPVAEQAPLIVTDPSAPQNTTGLRRVLTDETKI